MRWLFNGMDQAKLLERQLQLEHYLKCFLEILLNDPASPIYFGALEKTNSSSNIVMSNSISMNSLNSSVFSSPSSQSQNSSNLILNLNPINKAKLCSFCPIFEQTQQDLIYASRISLNRVSSFRNHRTSSNSFTNNLNQELVN